MQCKASKMHHAPAQVKEEQKYLECIQKHIKKQSKKQRKTSKTHKNVHAETHLKCIWSVFCGANYPLQTQMMSDAVATLRIFSCDDEYLFIQGSFRK